MGRCVWAAHSSVVCSGAGDAAVNRQENLVSSVVSQTLEPRSLGGCVSLQEILLTSRSGSSHCGNDETVLGLKVTVRY